ncbi:GNAT family N-acetyltransferase [Synechococcus elongatus IITB7]|uniref:GNAT family N-acetyltransferase n=1 Tax=Synechococcus elongatus TaxID=32046 RepID=UPI0030CE6D65
MPEGIIRPAIAADWPAIWAILEPIFRAGETYPYPPEISETEAQTAWMTVPTQTFVFEAGDRQILGTYYLKPNQPGLGSHVCNCGFAVAAAARGQGIGQALGQHALQVAPSFGFRAMQFNLVVATNTASIRIWQQLGFTTIGQLPQAFRHPQQGWVDALIFYKLLEDPAEAPHPN